MCKKEEKKKRENILDANIQNEQKKSNSVTTTIPTIPTIATKTANESDGEKEKKCEKRTHYLKEMICVEIALGKINRTKNGSIKIFSVLVYFYNHIKLSKCLTASICR